MISVTDEIRAQLRAELARRQMTQTRLARELGMSRTHLSNMLHGQRGQLPPTWQRLLDHLELELTFRSKRQHDV